MEGEAELMNAAEFSSPLDKWRRHFGATNRPSASEEPTMDQLSAIRELLRLDHVYLCFLINLLTLSSPHDSARAG